MKNGFAGRVLLTFALVIAVGAGCRGDTVFAGPCIFRPLLIVLPGEYPFRDLESGLGTGHITLRVGAERDLHLLLRDQGSSLCGVPSGNHFVWSTLDSTVARVYAWGDSVARLQAVSAGETEVLVRAVPDTNFRSLRGVTVVP